MDFMLMDITMKNNGLKKRREISSNRCLEHNRLISEHEIIENDGELITSQSQNVNNFELEFD